MCAYEDKDNYGDESVNHGNITELPVSVLKSVDEVVNAIATNHAKELRILRISSIRVIEREGPRYLVTEPELKGYIVPQNAVKILIEFDGFDGEHYFMNKECAGMSIAEIGLACRRRYENQYQTLYS
jgi:hypothetical protein